MSGFAESTVEKAALAWLASFGWEALHGPEIAHGSAGAERGSPGYRDVFLARRVRDALSRLNPELPPDAVGEAYRRLTRMDVPTLMERNRATHRMLTDGIRAEYRRPEPPGWAGRPAVGYAPGRCERA